MLNSKNIVNNNLDLFQQKFEATNYKNYAHQKEKLMLSNTPWYKTNKEQYYNEI